MDMKALWDCAAQTYDQTRRQYIPFFDDFYGAALALLPFSPDAAIQVLDLGAGTGLLTALIAAAFPQAHFTLADLSDEMLHKARQRFARAADRFRYQVMDMGREPFSGEYDAIVSALAIHHLSDDGKRAVYRHAYQALRPNGIFINADQTLGATPMIDALYHAAWLRQVRAVGTPERDIDAAVERMRGDQYATLTDQLHWLEAIGFQQVNCWYQNYRFAVFSGIKSNPNQAAMRNLLKTDLA